MEINISDLRHQRRPVWMTEFDGECGAAIAGGGGDIDTNRLPLDGARDSGEEVADDETVRELVEGGFVKSEAKRS